MKNNFLNVCLAVTAVVAVIMLVVFFVKMNNITPDSGNSDEKGIVADTGEKGAVTSAAKSGDTQATNVKKGDNEKSSLEDLTGKQGEDKVTVVSPSPLPTATPSPSPTPTPTPEPAYSGKLDPEKKMVALTFDDGPSANTKTILETLEQYGAHATFFMLGECVDQYPDMVKMVYESGSEVANHTTNHKNLNTLSEEEITNQVEGTQNKLNKVLGLDRNYIVRPPYGNNNEKVRNTIKHPLITWWVDTLDWDSRDPDAILGWVKKDVKDGAIILMHDIYATTAKAAQIVVPWLVEQGYQICSVSEMFAARGQKLENGKVYNSAISAEKYKENKANAGN